MDDSLWTNLGDEATPDQTRTAAQSKRPAANEDAPAQQPMRAGLKPAQRKAPTSDQKKHRRQMAKSASEGTQTATCGVCGQPLHLGGEGQWYHDNVGGGRGPVSPSGVPHSPDPIHVKKSSKESSMTEAQPTEEELLNRLAAATTLVEQASLSAQIESLRIAKREHLAREGSLDWEAMTTRVFGHTAHLDNPHTAAALSMEHIPGYSVTDATDWLDDVLPTHTADAHLSANMRAQATNWYNHEVWAPVKDSPQEFSTQAHNAARRSGAQFGLQAQAAASVFLQQVAHLASRDGIEFSTHLAAWGDDPFEGPQGNVGTPTYVSDGRDSLPVGVDPSQTKTFDEDTLGSGSGASDPKTTPNMGEAKSTGEGSQPASDHSAPTENPLTGRTDLDKSSGEFGKDTSDRMKTQGAAAPKGTCAICGKPMEQATDGSWMHNPSGTDVDYDDDHEAKPANKTSGLQSTAISVKNVGIDSNGNGTGTTADGTKVTFRLTDKERADLKSVLYSDLAMNFSGVDIEQSDIISEQGGSNSMTGPSRSASLFATIAAAFARDGGIVTHYQPHTAGLPIEDSGFLTNVRDQSPSGDEEYWRGVVDGETAAKDPSRMSVQTPEWVAQQSPQYQQGRADGLAGKAPKSGSAHTADSAPNSTDGLGVGIDEGDTPDGDHSESATQDTPGGDLDKSQARPSDNLPTGGNGGGTGVNWTQVSLSGLSPHAQTFVAALSRMSSLDEVIGGVSGHKVASLLAADPTCPAQLREALEVWGNPFVREAASRHEADSTPPWLRERVNDPYGTPNKAYDKDKGEYYDHPFWTENPPEVVGRYKIINKDGKWYGYDTSQNLWTVGFPDKQSVLDIANSPRLDMWASRHEATTYKARIPNFGPGPVAIEKDVEVLGPIPGRPDKLLVRFEDGHEGPIPAADVEGYHTSSRHEAAKSDTCPECGAHMSDVTVSGDTLRAKCGNCGWSGTKRKKSSSRHEAALAKPKDGTKSTRVDRSSGTEIDRATCTNCDRPILNRGRGWIHQTGGARCLDSDLNKSSSLALDLSTLAANLTKVAEHPDYYKGFEQGKRDHASGATLHGWDEGTSEHFKRGWGDGYEAAANA